MKYNPLIHYRKSIRLKGYDYSKAGAYFITICCEERLRRFGKVSDDKMILNELGRLAYDEWIKLAHRFSNFELDVFQIMPNHMHGIIVLSDVGANARVAQEEENTLNPTISDIIGAYKSIVSNECL
ncbi:transposase [Pedobacter ghigonis]|uniref:transposase n=1 Tax=Pedobacter ghigonis TaxID=2730403 RepID=UPI001C37A82C